MTPHATPKRRLPLGRTPRRLSYERQLRLILWLFSLPPFALLTLLLHARHATPAIWCASLLALLLAWAALQATLADRLLRPLQTLANVVSALREQDYSFRARGGRRGDSLGDLALEVNALANSLQAERLASLESAALIRRVLDVLPTPVLVVDSAGFVRFLNPAAARLAQLPLPRLAYGRHAGTLGLAAVLSAADEQVVQLNPTTAPTQWVLRRTSFREQGIPHQLLLLSDVSQALRDEERQAWRRLIRVLGHEINNSLTPIKSLAGSLRHMLRTQAPGPSFDRPLAVIEDRAESLNRFLAAYRQLAQLAPPRRQPLALAPFLERLATLETRLPVHVTPGREATIHADPDQLSQALINLIRNGAEAALENPSRPPTVTLSYTLEPATQAPTTLNPAQAATTLNSATSAPATPAPTSLTIHVRDSGLGIANPANLFVPFYTTKPNGTGIGLALVQQIAEAHHGRVTLTNHPDGGAEAALHLPLT